MAFRKIIEALAITVSFLCMISIAIAECDGNFYLYNFEISEGKVTYLGRSLEKGCMPGNYLDEYYKFNVEKGTEVKYSYYFNPTIRYTDVIENNEITGGITKVTTGRFSVPSPVVDFDQVKILDEVGNELIKIERPEIEAKENENIQRFGLFDWVNNAIKNVLRQLFG